MSIVRIEERYRGGRGSDFDPYGTKYFYPIFANWHQRNL